MVVFTSGDIEQNVYCNHLLFSLWRHQSRPKLSHQAVFLYNQKVRTKTHISQEREELIT